MKFNNIEAERARQGLTVEELAGQIGISRRTYYTWQSNNNIPASKLIAMAKLFGCSIDYLLGITTM